MVGTEEPGDKLQLRKQRVMWEKQIIKLFLSRVLGSRPLSLEPLEGGGPTTQPEGHSVEVLQTNRFVLKLCKESQDVRNMRDVDKHNSVL